VLRVGMAIEEGPMAYNTGSFPPEFAERPQPGKKA
jgi:hypothetical protein